MNDQFRICFRWTPDGPEDVEVVDYHCENTMTKNRMRPIHPGEILREEYLRPLDMSANRLAGAIHVPANRISGIVNGDRAITADTALRLAKFFGTTPEFWLNLQLAFELRTAEAESNLKGIRAMKVG